MNTRVSIDSEALLEEVGWVQALARRLVRDAGEAEDVAQEAVLVALRGALQGSLQGESGEPRALRQWLGAVVRNLGRNARRRGSRRARVEGPLEPEPALPSTLELLERAATQRALVGALMELEEPYRSVLLLRYFQGLTNEAIARREGIPASTVATRLARAHERLRAKYLAQNGGDRSTALAGLAALAGGLGEGLGEGVHAPLDAAPVSALSRVALAALPAAGLAGLLLGGAWLLRYASSPRAGRVPLEVHDPALLAAPRATSAPDAPRADLVVFLGGGRQPMPAQPPSPAPICPAPEGRPESIRGRVLDLDGQPVANVEVCRVAPEVTRPGDYPMRRGIETDQRATSGADGRFVLEAPRFGWLTASAPGWTTVLSGELWLDEGETLLVLAPARRVGGVVVSADGRPLEGVELALEVAPQRLLALGPLLDEVEPFPRATSTDADGAFAFDGAPSSELFLTAQKDGFELGLRELDASAPSEALRIELAPSTIPAVTGRVVDAAGEPVAEASVSLGQRIATSDADGAFHVSFDPRAGFDSEPGHGEPGAGSVLRAARAGVGLAQREIVLPGVGEPPLEVLLVLDERPRSIQGRVLDPMGEPVAGVDVFVLEDTPFGRAPYPDASQAWWVERSLEAMLGAQPVHTAADGRFRIEGLSARSYRVQAKDSARLIRATSAPIPPGSDGVELVLDRDAHGLLAGRVVDRHGRPVPGVRVSVSLREWSSGPDDRGNGLAIGQGAVTDAEGRFALEGVAREGVFLRLEGESIVPELFREIEPERTALELVVGLRCTLQVHWGDWSARADALHLEAEDGSRLGFVDLRGLSVTPMEGLAVETGLSPPVAIPDRAAHAVLTRGGSEVMRVRLHPVPGELELVRL